MKSLTGIIKKQKPAHAFMVPKNIQSAIPIECIWEDGVFLGEKGQYSMSYQFSDVNYQVTSEEEQLSIFMKYSEVVNSFDPGAVVKVTISNKYHNKKRFHDEILLSLSPDGLDMLRKDYNALIIKKVASGNNLIQEKFLTVTVFRKNISDARTYFQRFGSLMTQRFSKMGSDFYPLNATERLRIFHDFYRPGEEAGYRFSLEETVKKGHDFKDFICPDSLSIKSNHFKMGNRFGRVLFLREYANYISDDLVARLTSIPQNLMLSIDILSVPIEEGEREAGKRLANVQANINAWASKASKNNHSSARVPYDMELQEAEATEFLDDLKKRNQQMKIVVLTMVITADSLSELNTETERVMEITREGLCQMGSLTWQQLDGLQTALPFGVRKINTFRTLITESVSVFMPFRVLDVQHRGGQYIGENAVSGNLVLVDKAQLKNPNAFILGFPGSGKSMSAKLQIMETALSTKDDILIFDPEGEYRTIMEKLNGEIIEIFSGSSNHINAMEMSDDYASDSNMSPVGDKTDFIVSLMEVINKNKGGVSQIQRSIIDRCVESCYRSWKESGNMPTLCDLRVKLSSQPEDEARELALMLELFTTGSMNIFAHQTNVNTKNRILCYDVFQLGTALLPAALLVITDAMLNRVVDNWRRGVKTHIFIDEFHVAFENEDAAQFFESAWKRFRKRGGYPTGITQNVQFLLNSPTGSMMLSNSELILMFAQQAVDRDLLKQHLRLSEQQLTYVTDPDPGSGLLKIANSFIPIQNKIPSNSLLYKIMTTKPGE